MRDQHWPSRLAEFIESKREVHFEWGVNDCCLFASDGIKALTGIDPADGIRGKYRTALEAARVLKEYGGFIALIEKRCGDFKWNEVPPLTAQRGDLVVSTLEGGETCGLVVGGNVAFAGPQGVHLENLACATRAWRIN